jgi:ubiquinone/menaquinone biosynthesis C-methylase UbiE
MWEGGRKPIQISRERKPLIEVFGSRPDRFSLLKQGIEKVGLTRDDFVVEVGCARGDGALFLTENTGCRVLGLDFEERYIAEAWQNQQRNGHARTLFTVARAERLPVRPKTVDLVVSEAAFSLLPDKISAAREFGRVLKPGAYAIINDFRIKNQVEGELRRRMSYIPCFAGVGRVDDYCEAFEKNGFKTCSISDESKGLIRTALWIGKVYNSKAADISYVFAKLLSGSEKMDTIDICNNDCREFFRLARLGYVQAIFRKQL